MGYHAAVTGPSPPGLSVTVPTRVRLEDGTVEELARALAACPDVAFAHLAEVEVEGHEPTLVLFVWVVGRALRSLRSALNLVSRVVAGVLPEDRFVDVVLLNSAPDLLGAVESAGCLLVERDAGERAQALRALAAGEPEEPPAVGKAWWWPF